MIYLKKLVRCLMGFWMLFWGVFFSAFFGSIVILLSPFATKFDPHGKSLHKIAEIWARCIMFANPWWQYEVVNKKLLPNQDEAVVYIANHQSQTDIIALYLLKKQFRWLSKESLFKFPIFGQAMRKIGYIGVIRGDSRSQVKCMKESAERLEKGLSMAFFPEGTRSKDGKLLPFRNGAFKLAKEQNVPIVPITLVGTHHMLPKGSIMPNFSRVKLVVHSKIETQGKTLEELVDLGRKSILEGLHIT